MALEVNDGDGQSATVDEELPQPLVVRVVDSVDDTPIAGVEIEFVVTDGDGTVTPNQATTDASGEASATWSLGTTAGTQRVEARLEGAPDVNVAFEATASPGPANSLNAVPGNPQVGIVGVPLATPIAVIVRDAFGNPVPGVTVDWEVLEGNGVLDTSSTESNAEGMTSVQWTLGTMAGAQQIRAFTESGELLINALAQPGPPDPGESEMDVDGCSCLISILDLVVLDGGILDLNDELSGGLGDLIDNLINILLVGELVDGDVLLDVQVTVRDQYGNLIPDAEVLVEVTGVGTDLLNGVVGEVTLDTGDEGALLGIVDLDWELLGALGLHEITVTIEGLDPIQVEADVS